MSDRIRKGADFFHKRHTDGMGEPAVFRIVRVSRDRNTVYFGPVVLLAGKECEVRPWGARTVEDFLANHLLEWL